VTFEHYITGIRERFLLRTRAFAQENEGDYTAWGCGRDPAVDEEWNEFREQSLTSIQGDTFKIWEPCNALSGIDFDRTHCTAAFWEGGDREGVTRHRKLLARIIPLLSWGNLFFHGGNCNGYSRVDTLPIDMYMAVLFDMVHPDLGPIPGLGIDVGLEDNEVPPSHLLTGEFTTAGYDFGRVIEQIIQMEALASDTAAWENHTTLKAAMGLLGAVKAKGSRATIQDFPTLFCPGATDSNGSPCDDAHAPNAMAALDMTTLVQCQGDCDADSDCAGTLRCHQRSGNEPVPGCDGPLRDDVDYCYDPKYHPEFKIPSYMTTISMFAKRVTQTCSIGCLFGQQEIVTALDDVIAGGLGSASNYAGDERTGFLMSNLPVCTAMLGILVDFVEALTWQEGPLLGIDPTAGPGAVLSNAQCGWDADEHSVIDIQQGRPHRNTEYNMHSRWHWAATDVLANMYQVSKMVIDEYQTCNSPTHWWGLKIEQCCYPLSSGECG
jgi:hypothetical protein